MTFVEPKVFEVFRREIEGGPLVHAGGVIASTIESALLYARELYARHSEHCALFVAPRDSFAALDVAPTLTQAAD
jgi:1,2-phenylacetyl-CoA epoxidase PaaB subunit